jgi:hypothetical protein
MSTHGLLEAMLLGALIGLATWWAFGIIEAILEGIDDLRDQAAERRARGEIGIPQIIGWVLFGGLAICWLGGLGYVLIITATLPMGVILLCMAFAPIAIAAILIAKDELKRRRAS